MNHGIPGGSALKRGAEAAWKLAKGERRVYAEDLSGVQRVAAWVELKRVHLGFMQTLNANVSKHSNLLQLVKHAMLAQHEAQTFKATLPSPGAPGAACVTAWLSLHRAVSDAAFRDEDLARIVAADDLKGSERVLSALAAPLKREDAALAAFAREAKVDDPDRALKWSRELAGVNRELRAYYIANLKSKGLI